MKTSLFTGLLTVLLAVSMISCTDYEALDKKEYERETAEINSAKQGQGLPLYKGIKLVVRATPISADQDTVNFDSLPPRPDAKSQLLANSTLRKLVNRMLGAEVGENVYTEQAISVMEWVDIIRNVATLKDEIKGLKEDDFPTMLHTLTTIEYILDNNSMHPDQLDWTANHEHLMLAGMLQKLEFLPGAAKVYEMEKSHPEELANDELKPLAMMMKGYMYQYNNWHYHAEEQFTRAIEATTDQAVAIKYDVGSSLMPGTEAGSAEGQLAQLQAMAYWMRAYCRYAMKAEHKHDQASEDIELFLKIADRLSLDNEVSWAAACMHHIYQEDKVQALVYLNKLRNSDALSATEKNALNQVEKYLEERRNGDALNVFYDKLFMGDLTYGYVTSHLESLSWYKTVLQSDAGQNFLGFPDQMDGLFEKVEMAAEIGGKIENAANELKDKGKALFDKLDW